MKTKLTKTEYVTLQGLFYLCEKAYSDLKEAESAAEEVIGETQNYSTHCSIISDTIYGDENFNAKDFCKKHKIQINK
jgi:hypothetical protein